MQKQIDSLINHTIVCGYGRNGKQALMKLRKFNQQTVIVEMDSENATFLEKDKSLAVSSLDAWQVEIIFCSGVISC